MKRLNIISLISACLFLLCAASRAEQGKAASRKIVLEDEEVTLLDGNGKELEKLTTSRTGKEKAAINKQVREKVLKSLGIKSVDELKGNRQLAQRYFKESVKFIKVKKLTPTRLKFLDDQGKLAKEVPIGYSTTVSTIGAETAEARKSLWGTRARAGRKIEERVMRTPTVASSQNAAVIAENVSNFTVAESSVEAKMFEGTDAANLGVESSLEYYDEKGNMTWKKKFDWNTSLFNVGLSENGQIVAAIQGCELGCSRVSQNIPAMIVLDSSGKELLSFPSTGAVSCGFPGDLWVSLDGNYTMLSCRSGKGWPKSILINVKEQKFWRAPYLISIIRGEDGHEIREGTQLRIGVTEDNELGAKATEIDLEKLSWQKLP